MTSSTTGAAAAARHRVSTSTRWHFAFTLCCHSNETRAPIANLPNSAQLEGTFDFPTYIWVRAVVWEWVEGQTHRQTRETNIHFASSTTRAKCNALICNIHSIREISDRRCGQSPRGQRRNASVSGQLTQEVRFKRTFKGSYCSRSFDNSRDFIPYLGWIAAKGMLTKISTDALDLMKLLVKRAQNISRPIRNQSVTKVNRLM